ncbi:MAG: hypothetical protein JXK94_03620 [Deltaproteobacteria bacterium]|nr:hypothetical protein [Deltaproteobacteria bacterium]
MKDFLEEKLSSILPIIQARIMENTTWFGVKTLKNPFDFWVYQEILYQQQPDFIIEIGVRFGGSTLALGQLCELIGKGKVIGIDISLADVSERVWGHPRINLVEGDACSLVDEIKGLIPEGGNVLVIEDSSHTFENTLNVLQKYSTFIPVGGYFIVEDGICHHGLNTGPKPGPYEATEAFIKETPNFIIDSQKEDFLVTWNPHGYLRRIF